MDDLNYLDRLAAICCRKLRCNSLLLLFCVFLKVGRYGDKSLLDSAIDRVARDQYGVRHPVSLHVMEFGTRMYSAATGQKVLYYPYPQVEKK